MILHTGLRTDIPAFYAPWFANRLKAQFVCVRNPYNPGAVTQYSLNPQVVDLIAFCTKNPAPMFPFLELLQPYGQYWFVTITPYGKDIEPNVPAKEIVIESFQRLSGIVGPNAIGWRYDPILLTAQYTADWHIAVFETMAAALAGYTHTCVISFLDLYQKVRRNFPEAKAVPVAERHKIGREFARLGKPIRTDCQSLRRRTRSGSLGRGLQRLHDSANLPNRPAMSITNTKTKARPRPMRLPAGQRYRRL